MLKYITRSAPNNQPGDTSADFHRPSRKNTIKQQVYSLAASPVNSTRFFIQSRCHLSYLRLFLNLLVPAISELQIKLHLLLCDNRIAATFWRYHTVLFLFQNLQIK